ncbi:MAG TPA: ABC transporter ATP-binding protein [Oscillospiraceae bacterium]|nr:ABC transporter ATP-binding protein [Oscillospiraceae bacterium]
MSFQIKWLWLNMKGKRARYIMCLFMSVLCNILILGSPIIGQKIVDIFIANDNAAQNLIERRGLFTGLIIGMIVLTLAKTGLQYFTNISYEICSQHLLYNVKVHMFSNLQVQDMNYYNRNRAGDLMTRMTGDLEMVRHSVAWIIKTMLESLSLFVITLVYFFTLDVWMTLCFIAFTPIIFAVSRRFSNEVRPKYVDLRERLSQLNSKAQENIAGNRVIKAFAREEYEMEQFDIKNRDYSAANKTAATVWLKYHPLIETFAQALWVVQMIVGGIFVINGRITLGEYGAFGALLWTISNPIRNIGMLINDMQRFFASVAKVIEVYYSRSTIANNKNLPQGRRYKGEVEFKNVTLKFDSTTILDDISFSIEPGQTLAIMGPTGSGKTSLVNLIPRFMDAKKGAVLIDGTDVKKLSLDELRKNIGMSTQEVLLFSDTVDGNIAYGRSDMPEEETRKFASLAAASDFIEKMPQGYDTVIGERGVGISGGQKQRVALARAMAIRPSILILDDTTSAVDMETEMYIQESLRSLDFECTKIIIAQRISSTRDADKILILSDGKIIEQGTHSELIENRGYYYEVFMLQNEGIDVSAAASAN